MASNKTREQFLRTKLVFGILTVKILFSLFLVIINVVISCSMEFGFPFRKLVEILDLLGIVFISFLSFPVTFYIFLFSLDFSI